MPATNGTAPVGLNTLGMHTIHQTLFFFFSFSRVFGEWCAAGLLLEVGLCAVIPRGKTETMQGSMALR